MDYLSCKILIFNGNHYFLFSSFFLSFILSISSPSVLFFLLSSFFPHPPSHRRKGAPTTSRACFRQTTCHHHPHHHHKLEPGSTAPTPSSFPFLLSSSNTDDGCRRPCPLDSICCKGRDRKMYRDPGLHCGKPRRPDVSQGSSYFLFFFLMNPRPISYVLTLGRNLL